MQSEADSLLREALDCYDDGAIEEGDLSVIGLALEQFHHAVADRRVVLGALGVRSAAGTGSNAEIDLPARDCRTFRQTLSD